ncbi:MAG: arginase family protein [Pseudomonadota bacterium]|nr:arginase family protein [Pseudomonadota bacterium]
MTQQSRWPRITDLITTEGRAEIALIGAQMEAKSVTPGSYHLAPEVIRNALRRFSTYDVETDRELDLVIRDWGDVPVQGVAP